MKSSIQYLFCISALCLFLNLAAYGQTTTQSQKFGANPTIIAPSAVLEVESANKGVLFPRIALTSAVDVSTIALPATGLTIFNTASAGTSPNAVSPGYYYWNGTKWVKLAVETPFAKTVYVNATSPTTATIFDENNPAASNDNGLKTDDANLYIGSDGSTWTYNTTSSAYSTFTAPASTPFNLTGTSTDAGSNKTSGIWRSGGVGIGINNPKSLLEVSPPTGSSSIAVGTIGTGTTEEVSINFISKYDRTNAFLTSANRGWQIGARGDATVGTAANSYAQKNAFHASYWTGTTLTPTLTILPSGNVGIKGITNPQQALDIGGTALFRINDNSAQQIQLGFSNGHQIRSRHSGATSASNAIDFNVWRAAPDNAPRQVLTLQGDGNVGIGITNPTAVVDVNSPVAATATINTDISMMKFTRPTSAGAKVGNVAQFNMGSYSINGTDALTRLDLGLNNLQSLSTSPVMTWLGNGNVGVGTTAPTNKLEINQGTTGNSGLRFTNLNSSSVANTSTSKVLSLNSTGDVILANVPGTQNIVAFSTATPTTSGVVFTPDTPADQSVIYQSSTDNSMWTYNGTAYVTYTPPASTAWLLAGTSNDAGSNKTGAIGRTGKVGIGTTSPFSTLDVIGGINVRNLVGGWGTYYGIEINTSSFSPRLDFVFNGAYIGQFSSDANDFLYKNSKPTTGGHRFFTKPDIPSAATEKMVILNNGNVGIGTTTPSTTLEVTNLNTTAFQPTIIASSNPSALAATGFNATDPSNIKPSSGIQFLGWAGAKEGGIFRQTGSSNKSHMLFTVNNTNDVAMVINENRNVGIGMDIGLEPYTTRHKLTVRGLDAQPSAQGTRPSNAIFRVDGNTQHSLDFGTLTNAPYGAYVQVQNKQNTDGLPLILNPTGGSVGIGVLSPQTTLHVQNSTPATNTVNAAAQVLRLSRPGTGGVKWDNIAQFSLGSYGTTTFANSRLDLGLTDGDNNSTISHVMTWQGNGRVGIKNTAPAYALDVTGDINATGAVRVNNVALTSDARLKTNVIDLSSGLSKIMQLRPVNYDKKFTLDSEATSNEHGFIAQELQKVMPELVSEGKDKDKLLSVNYVAIIPVLTKALQEQQKIIEQNQATIQKQQVQIDELKLLVEKVLNKK